MFATRHGAILVGAGLNMGLLSRGIDPAVRTIGKVGSISDAIKSCRTSLLSHYKAGESRRNIAVIIDKLERDLGRWPVTVGVKFIHDYLEGYTVNSYIRAVIQLERIFAYCYRAGLLPLTHTNPASVLEKKKTPEAKRERLGLNEYKAIYAKAPQWLRVGMDLMLHTGLRPGDVVNLKFSQYDDGVLSVSTAKTGKRLAIRLSEGERGIVEKARLSGIVSEYIVHRLPDRRGRRKRGKSPTQLTVPQLSNKFSEIRTELGIGGENPPTLYEIRSLSSRLYELAGRDRKEIQALLAHTDQRMTDHYIDARTGTFVEVYAGLEIGREL